MTILSFARFVYSVNLKIVLVKAKTMSSTSTVSFSFHFHAPATLYICCQVITSKAWHTFQSTFLPFFHTLVYLFYTIEQCLVQEDHQDWDQSKESRSTTALSR